MGKSNIQKLEVIRKEVEALIGETVQTVWGPSLVVGIVKTDDDRDVVHLREFGEEDYHVSLEQWHDTLM